MAFVLPGDPTLRVVYTEVLVTAEWKRKERLIDKKATP